MVNNKIFGGHVSLRIIHLYNIEPFGHIKSFYCFFGVRTFSRIMYI